MSIIVSKVSAVQSLSLLLSLLRFLRCVATYNTSCSRLKDKSCSYNKFVKVLIHRNLKNTLQYSSKQNFDVDGILPWRLFCRHTLLIGQNGHGWLLIDRSNGNGRLNLLCL